MRGLLFHSFAFLFCVSPVVSVPLGGLGSLFGSDSNSGESGDSESQSVPESSPARVPLPSSNLVVAHFIVGNSYSDVFLLQKYISNFRDDPRYQRIGDEPLVSAFSGQDCKFGQSNSNAGWLYAIKRSEPVYFVPAFFVDPAALLDYTVMDGGFNWNAAWPMGDYDINFDPDNSWIEKLGGRTYMAGVSPWFFTHYSNNKNFIHLSDNWMFVKRWELLIANRDRVDIAQSITWNDFGESHYLSPLLKDDSQPDSEKWVDGFDHQGWLDLFAYYIAAFKTGAYPAIERDRIFLWARLYPANASPSPPDAVGPPANGRWTHDFLWAVVLLAGPADVVLQCGSTRQTWGLESGLAKV
ncbi:glycosyl hydrolase family 71-domain-containing protein [Mycena rosella]|uniref:Glycosyl hydrolase family 71-domain-containing protein n=1 Tax=Mycena rosella TaxID=1033263 RepID=A0AAD7DNJ4_MYCRO|nr:glycosyl hydrolase family 71-domain-containing protein [Mycena rosella]